MKIALFSDIHANLPALEACLKSIAGHKPDAVYCLGDLVGYNTWPNEVINEIRHRGIPTIMGNYDQGIGLNSNDCGCAYKTDLEKEMGAISISYTNEVTGAEERAFLRSLPANIRIEYKSSDDVHTLLLVHGSPRKINEYLFEDREEKSLLNIMEKAEADIMCFGHTHKPYHRVITSGSIEQPYYRHAINIGSVGKPKDGNPQGCYALLTIDENTSPLAKESLGVDFIRFDYDIELAAKAIEQSILPDAYADMLRNAY
jgi:putative phosphoesterase